MSEKGGLDISSDQIFALYQEAGTEIPYTEANFTYDSDILMGGQKDTRIKESIDRLGISHQPAKFQAIFFHLILSVLVSVLGTYVFNSIILLILLSTVYRVCCQVLY